MNSKIKSGFTLIEVIIYIALFSILLGGAFVTAFQLMNGSNKTYSDTAVQEEGDFVSRKINWALTGLDPTNPPSVGGLGCSQTLTTKKVNHPMNPIVVRLNVNTLEVSENGGSYLPLTTSNVKVSCFKARIIPATGTGPTGVTATTTINSIDFAVTKYFRK